MAPPGSRAHPDVTVIVAVLNGAAYLAEALASIRDQAGVETDLVVVDGGSSDGSPGIAADFGARILREEQRGLANAWNTGIAVSSAPFVAFLDSDDIWVANTLADRVAALDGAPQAGISVGRVVHMLAADVSPKFRPKLDVLLSERLAPIPGTMLVRRAVFERIGRFDTSYKLSADSDWIARSRTAGIEMVDVDRLVLRKRLHASNLTTGVDVVQSELLAILRGKIASERTHGC